MTLRDYLRVPYIVAASSDDRGDGTWVRVAECPELPDCRVSATSMVAAMEDLTRERVRVILRELSRGTAPPIPRPPLEMVDVEGQLRSSGLLEELSELLDLPVEQLEGRAIPV